MSSRRIVPIGPYHPLQEEPEFFKLIVEGDTVVDLEINLGYNHRGHEFISPELTYDQIPFLVERICSICSNSHPLATVLAVEDLCGIKPPPRGAYIRTIVHELERIHSHLLWVGLAGHFIGYNTVWMWAWRYREHILEVFEMITGNRNHYAANKPGGTRRDILPGQIPQILAALDVAEKKTMMLTTRVGRRPSGAASGRATSSGASACSASTAFWPSSCRPCFRPPPRSRCSCSWQGWPAFPR